jgi:TolB-like protein/Flp pilus assembly protein TadD
VLPLGVASSDSNLVYFAEGVAEELVGELSRMPSIHVISHESSRLCDPKVLSIKRIARDLGAQRLVTGDLRQVHGQVHINVHFVDARNDHELAFQSFKGDAKELLALQTDVRRSVARAVFKLSGQRDKSSFEPRGTTDAAAYEDYLRARYHWSRRPDELPQAIEYFGRAIHADSMYASAWAGLADAWADMGLYGLQPPLQTRIEARAAARRAVQVDDELSTAHSSLAQVLHNYEWDWESAEAEYRHAIDLNPSDADAHHGLAHLLVQLGRRDEAMREIRAAIALNPRSLPTAIAEGSFQYFARNYDSALVVLKRVAQLDTTNVLLHRLSAAVLDRLGRRDEAVGMLVRAVELQRQPALAAGIRQAYAAGGIEGALKLLIAAYLQKRAAGAYEPAEHLAELYARLGQVEDAFHWLEIAFREHDTELNRLKVDPLFDPLRKDPRFADLMKRVGFQEASR